ncbi:thioredoxin family protein [Alicyclobacillus curvatus]|jgi:thiol-disulfide isomerase/thioredoxin|nr:thioredoxin family protein [Alicyclobacillus curvatus]
MEEITSLEQYVNAIRADKPTVMLFSADWCPDCRYLDTFIDEVVEAHQSEYDFYHVDTERFPELCETYDVMGIPSFLAYHKGQVVTRFVNRNRKTKREVEGFLEQVHTAVESA